MTRVIRTLLPPIAAAQIPYCHPASPQHERRHLVRLPQPAGAEALERGDQHLLHQVFGGMLITQVPQAIEPGAAHIVTSLHLVHGTQNQPAVVQQLITGMCGVLKPAGRAAQICL